MGVFGCAGRVLYRLWPCAPCTGRVLYRTCLWGRAGADMSAPRPAFDLHPARAAGHPAQWAHSPGCDSPLPLAGEGEVHEEQVEGDDDGRDEETCDTQGAIVDVVAHDLTVCGQAHEWDDREGDAE